MPGYGWKPDLNDIRDHKLRFAPALALSTAVDLRSTGFLPPVWDQANLGSCVPHGVDAAVSYSLAAAGTGGWDGSKLFIYYNGRTLENTVSEDSGLTITDGVKAVNRYGSAPTVDWPYNVSRFTERPPQKAFDDGVLHEAVKYARVAGTNNDMKSCLAAGVPFVIGFTVYESFESDATASNGFVSMPTSRESVLGGHCMLVVGYRADGYYIVRNSWGTGWGDGGYCYMPSAYLTNSNLAGDFWAIQTVSAPSPAPPLPDPPPAPVLVADANDRALWAATKAWANARHVTSNKAAATAVRAWATAKGLS